MKCILTGMAALTLTLASADSAFAQRGGGPRRNAGSYVLLPTGWVRWFQSNLKLDKAKAEQLNEQAKDLDAQMKALEKQFFETAKPYLDDKQLKKFEQYLAKRESQNKLRGSIGARLKRFPAMFRVWGRRLGCDEAQVQQIDAIIDEYTTQSKAIRNDEAAQIQLAEETYNQIYAELTPDQQQMLNDVIEGKRPAPPRKMKPVFKGKPKFNKGN